MDASKFIQTVEDTLSNSECEHLIDLFDRPLHRNTADGQWSEITVPEIERTAPCPFGKAALPEYVAHYNKQVGLTLPVPCTSNTEEFRIKRYQPRMGDEFRVHHDAKGFYCNRYLVLLWYLNDVAEGGETVFPDLGVSIKPKAGRLLMFPPHWMFQHAGLPPISNDKYILSTYLLY